MFSRPASQHSYSCIHPDILERMFSGPPQSPPVRPSFIQNRCQGTRGSTGSLVRLQAQRREGPWEAASFLPRFASPLGDAHNAVGRASHFSGMLKCSLGQLRTFRLHPVHSQSLLPQSEGKGPEVRRGRGPFVHPPSPPSSGLAPQRGGRRGGEMGREGQAAPAPSRHQGPAVLGPVPCPESAPGPHQPTLRLFDAMHEHNMCLKNHRVCPAMAAMAAWRGGDVLLSHRAVVQVTGVSGGFTHAHRGFPNFALYTRRAE